VEHEGGQERRDEEGLGEGDEDALAVVRDGLLKGGELATGCHDWCACVCVCVCERGREGVRVLETGISKYEARERGAR